MEMMLTANLKPQWKFHMVRIRFHNGLSDKDYAQIMELNKIAV